MIDDDKRRLRDIWKEYRQEPSGHTVIFLIDRLVEEAWTRKKAEWELYYCSFPQKVNRRRSWTDLQWTEEARKELLGE